MQTNFSEAQLADPVTRAAEKILRACVHCGFCTATCPRYTLLGDELDSRAMTRRWRVALLTGCAQQALAPQINEATIHLLTRHGCEVVIAEGAGCCGALNHHLGQDGHAFLRVRIFSPSRSATTPSLRRRRARSGPWRATSRS
jgi:Fe-S oxidoreductase